MLSQTILHQVAAARSLHVARNIAKRKKTEATSVTASDVRELETFTDKCFIVENTNLKRRVQPSKLPAHHGIKN